MRSNKKEGLNGLKLGPSHTGHCLFSQLWDPCLTPCSETPIPSGSWPKFDFQAF